MPPTLVRCPDLRECHLDELLGRDRFLGLRPSIRERDRSSGATSAEAGSSVRGLHRQKRNARSLPSSIPAAVQGQYIANATSSAAGTPSITSRRRDRSASLPSGCSGPTHPPMTTCRGGRRIGASGVERGAERICDEDRGNAARRETGDALDGKARAGRRHLDQRSGERVDVGKPLVRSFSRQRRMVLPEQSVGRGGAPRGSAVSGAESQERAWASCRRERAAFRRGARKG